MVMVGACPEDGWTHMNIQIPQKTKLYKKKAYIYIIYMIYLYVMIS